LTLQPLTTGQLLDRTFTLYRKHALLFMTIAAAPHLLYLIGMTLFQMTATSGMDGTVALVTMISIGVFFLIAYFALIGLSQAATAVAISDVYLDRPSTVSSAFARVRGKGFRYFGIVFGIALLTGIGFVCLVIPGIYFAITYALTLVISTNEGLGWTKATRRSKELVKGNRNRIAVIFLLSVVITYAAAFGFTIPATMLSALLVEKFPMLANIVVLLAGFLANTIAGPVALIGFTLAYYDARVRKEAFDIQLMMEDSSRAMAAGQGA
jgi:hypothetical protein